MGDVVLYIATSLDGYVADAEGGVEWLENLEDTYDAGEPGGSFEAFFDGVDCLVLGATTYEQVRGFGEWPYGDRRAVVTTSRELPRATEHIELYDGPLADLVGELTETHDTIWLVGGATLARSALAADLLDEVRLSVVPRLLGDGISLFGESGIDRRLHLTDETAYEDGIVELRYDVSPK